MPGDGNCFFYAVAHAVNLDEYKVAYDLFSRQEQGDSTARVELIALIRRHTPADYQIDTEAPSGQLLRSYGEFVVHNFRQDIAADIIADPGRYADAMQNIEG